MTVGNQVVKEEFKAILRHTYITFTPIQFVHGRAIQRLATPSTLFPAFGLTIASFEVVCETDSVLCRITLLYGNVLGSGELDSFMICFNTRCQYIPANQSLMIQPFVQPLKHNLSQKNPIKYPSQPTLGHISVCSVVINISPRKMDFIGPNKGRPKLEPWGVNDFFHSPKQR